MKRIFWFGTGAASGFGCAVYGYARLRREAGRTRADQVAGRLVKVARGGMGAARELIDDTREAVREAENELRTRPGFASSEANRSITAGHSERSSDGRTGPPGPRRLPRPARRSERRLPGMLGELDQLGRGED